MKKFLTAAIAATAFYGASALAAPPTAPIFNWSGYYVGGNAGYSWGGADTNGSYISLNNRFVNGPVTPFSTSLKPDGIIGGGQFGYNWQATKWVFGFAGDIQASRQKDSGVSVSTFAFPEGCCNFFGTNATTLESKLKSFETVRGRIGYAWENAMLYATGGFAFGRVALSGTNITNGATNGGVVTTYTDVASFSHSQNRSGWALGGGLEYVAWAPNWTWNVEYLHIDLGRVSATDSVSGLNTSTCCGMSISTVTFTSTTRVTDNIVRIGLNYKFGGH